VPVTTYESSNLAPRPITVHEDLLENSFDLVVRFLFQILRVADWAASNLNDVCGILQSETNGSSEGVAEAYCDDFHKSL